MRSTGIWKKAAISPSFFAASMHRSWAGLFTLASTPLSSFISNSSTVVAGGRLNDLIWTRTFFLPSFHDFHHGDVRDGSEDICYGFNILER